MLSATQAPPPLAIDLRLDSAGSVVPTTGIATIRGTVTCNRPVFVYVSGEVQQQIGRATVRGWLSAAVLCEGTAPVAWSSVVTSELRTFVGGRAAALFTGGGAIVSASAWAYDPASGEFGQDGIQEKVVLRG